MSVSNVKLITPRFRSLSSPPLVSARHAVRNPCFPVAAVFTHLALLDASQDPEIKSQSIILALPVSPVVQSLLNTSTVGRTLRPRNQSLEEYTSKVGISSCCSGGNRQTTPQYYFRMLRVALATQPAIADKQLPGGFAGISILEVSTGVCKATNNARLCARSRSDR
jgi:hypothetical protein